MDRGIPTEKTLEQMRQVQPPVHYLVGTPRGRLSQYEQKLASLPWQVAREGVSVKLLAQEQELYVLAQSKDRVNKERAMRRRQLKGLWQRLKKLQGMKLKRDALLKKLGAALHEYPAAARLVQTAVAARKAQLTFSLRKDKLRQVRKREGRYLLRSNITTGRSPGRALAVLHSTDRSGSRLQKPQGRLGAAAHLSPTGTPDRGAYLHLLSGLLSARDACIGACAIWRQA